MKIYIALWHPTSHGLLLDEVNRYAKQGWRLFSFHDSNRRENFTAVMERDIPEPPTDAHLTKEDYETLKSAYDWLVHFAAIGAIKRSEASPETWDDYIKTRGAIAALKARAEK